MKILKFGGTSVASSQEIKRVRSIVGDLREPGVVVVVSAMGGITDLLLKMATLASEQDPGYKDILKEIENRHLACIRELLPVDQQSAVLSKVKSELNILETLVEGAFLIGETTPRLLDKIVSYGELLSSFIISQFFSSEGLDACFKDSRELIITNEIFGKAVVRFDLTNPKIRDYFDNSTSKIHVLPGFIASSVNGNSTTLGRGGSDYTAAVIAAATEAEELEIWTDVSGMYTANPKLVKQAKAIEHISYEEAMELSHFGAKVLYPPTIQPVLSKDIPIRIKNTFQPDAPGTLVTRSKNGKGKTVRGISN
ncbi:MAG: aspartate kinase, partial [Flavobacteriaceae bacterium]|nr:aspartate kinase [Flavobacteriaceae bacterium]